MNSKDNRRFSVTGMSCAVCAMRVERAVSKVPGVTSCSVSLLTNEMSVTGTASDDEIVAAVVKIGFGATPVAPVAMTSGSASEDRDNHPAEDDTRHSSPVTRHSSPVTRHSSPVTRHSEASGLRLRLVASLVLLAVLMYATMGHMMLGWPLPRWFTQPEPNHVAMGLAQLLLSGTVLVINQHFFTSGFRAVLHGAPNMDTLVALGAGAAYAWSVAVLFLMTRAQVLGGTAAAEAWMGQYYFESAAMIVTLITVGKLLEAHAKGRTTSALAALLRLAPKTATVVRDGRETEIPASQVRVGDVFLVRPGENIPVDGVVNEGESAVNESALTGESIPVDKAPGASVSAATSNVSGFLRCRATRVGEDTTLAQIVRLMQDAAATKAPIARLADRVAAVFVPSILLVALVTLGVWLACGAEAGFALARAISVLVVSCPCALGLATPVAIMVGSGVGARRGILFKTASALEAAGRTEIVVLDKTGTVTSGEPEVVGVFAVGEDTHDKEEVRSTKYEGKNSEGRRTKDEGKLLAFAAALEKGSEHPLAKAIVRKAAEIAQGSTEYSPRPQAATPLSEGGELRPAGLMISPLREGAAERSEAEGVFRVDSFRALPGSGVEAQIGGLPAFGGSVAAAAARGIALTPALSAAAEEAAAKGATPLVFAHGGKALGIIAVADAPKSDASDAIHSLRGLGLRVLLLTGDNERTARAVADTAGIDEVVAGVLPDGKHRVVENLKKEGRVAMVGDGVNDAPALAAADLGIAIGAGTDVAIDAAGAVLVKSRLSDVPAALRLGRATLRNIKENLFWAFFYNVLLIPLAAGLWYPFFGWKMHPDLGALAMSLSSFCVVANALRLNFAKLNA